MDYRQPIIPHGGIRQELLRGIAATTDITSLGKMITEAYTLTVTLERDILAIKAQHSLATMQAQHEHEQIMKALTDGFAAQEQMVGGIMAVATKAMDAGDHELAHAILTQLMQLQASQPGVVDKAYSRRSGF